MNNANFTNRFNIEIVEDKGNTKLKRKNIRIKLKTGDIKYKQIREVYDIIVASGIDASKISIAGMGPSNYYTFKSWMDTELKEFDEDDYFKNRAKDAAKFDGFKFCDFRLR
jgi:hypothetical protein